MWESLDRGSTARRIEEQVLRVLDEGQLKAGDRLPPERELARLLGVSRPTLREAIGALQAQGRLQVRHGQGVFVAEPATAQELRTAMAQHELTVEELFAMREVLEVPAAGWAAERQDEGSLTRVQRALEALNEAAAREPQEFAELQRLDSAFHLAIVEAAGNRFLRQTLGVLQDILARGMETTLMVPGRLDKSRQEHERILAALLDGDPAGARTAARRHVRAAHRTAVGRLQAQEKALARKHGA
ncbi:FadR/GntR family transcriptional regulator [Streptomyces odontomachi]|uniref:FadR/GntR family transcriptional regulator n=1 Tax=Streptomyces odontomachi TaxID=2944940 RepID=UPI00210BA38C|nr:FCD domain-containing protein [Streptomyces sp. ODS25]